MIDTWGNFGIAWAVWNKAEGCLACDADVLVCRQNSLLYSSQISPKAWHWDSGSTYENFLIFQLGVNISQDGSSFVSAHVTADSFFLTYQVLPQLFVVGDDAVVDDDKLCESSSKSD